MSSFDSNLIEMIVCIEIAQNIFHFLHKTIILKVALSFAHNFCSVCSIFPITPIYSLHSIMFSSHNHYHTRHTIPSILLPDYQNKKLYITLMYKFPIWIPLFGVWQCVEFKLFLWCHKKKKLFSLAKISFTSYLRQRDERINRFPWFPEGN